MRQCHVAGERMFVDYGMQGWARLHVEIEKYYYSVPHQLQREKVWARITARTVEVFHRGQRVAAHMRSSSKQNPHQRASLRLDSHLVNE